MIRGVGIGDRAGQPVIGVRDDRSARSERHRVPIRVVEVSRLEELWHRLAGRAPGLAAGHEVVVGAVDRAQTIGHVGIRNRLRRGGIAEPVAGGVVEPAIREKRAGGVETQFRELDATRMCLGDLDLLQDERQILKIELYGHGHLPNTDTGEHQPAW